MKILKISDDLHKKLKEHLEGTSVFMQSYTEYFLNQAIQKEIVYAMKDKIDDFKSYIFTQELKGKKGSRTVIKSVEIKKKNPQYFYIKPKDQQAFDEYLETLVNLQYHNFKNGLTDLYFNLPGYDNVKHPKIEPENKQGVLKYISKSRTTGYSMFTLLANIPESLEKQLAKPIDGEFQLSVDCEIEEAPSPYNVLEDHMSRTMDFNNIDKEFLQETGVKLESEKIDLPKKEGFSLKEFKKDLVEFVIDNSIIYEDSSALKKITFDETEESGRKVISKIISISNIIATTSRFGPATQCIIPSWITEHVKKANDITSSYTPFDKKHNEEGSKIMNPIGSLAGITFFESDLVDDIHVYRTCENSFKYCYNFDKCDVNDINSMFINDSKGALYKIHVLKEFDTEEINDWIVDKIKDYPFIDIDGTYSPYSLNVKKTSLTNKELKKEDEEFLRRTGLDIDAKNKTALMSDVLQGIIKNSIKPDDDKTHQLKIYGNEKFSELIEMIDDTFDKYSRKEDTPIVTSSRVASFIADFSGYSIMSSNKISYSPMGLLYPTGMYKKRQIYVDPFMRWDDLRMLFMNDIQLKYSKDGILISAYENSKCVELTTSYKVIKDIIAVNIVDNENRMTI